MLGKLGSIMRATTPRYGAVIAPYGLRYEIKRTWMCTKQP